MDETTDDQRRLFFGMEAIAPWPEKLPDGRIMDASYRHATVAFLGQTPFSKLMELLESFPPPPFKVGFAGMADRCLILPQKHKPPRVVAWHVNMLEDHHALATYQKSFMEWLAVHGFKCSEMKRHWLPHITVCRAPFVPKKWKKAFTPLSVMMPTLRLYESLGNLQYETRWRYDWKAPYEEIEHTADVAFRVRGENLRQLHYHAAMAMASIEPALLEEIAGKEWACDSLDEIIARLNQLVTATDTAVGCGFKAVSYHGTVMEDEDGTLSWEMIIDV